MAPTGRRTKLTPEVSKRLTQAIQVGATYQLACQFAGITFQTFLNWKARAARGDRQFLELFDGITRVEGEAAVKWLAIIEQHAMDNPAWAAWKLERRYPDMYGRQRVELTGAKDAAPVSITVRVVDIEEPLPPSEVVSGGKADDPD